jgi:serine/threonine protein phosphatase PrpC
VSDGPQPQGAQDVDAAPATDPAPAPHPADAPVDAVGDAPVSPADGLGDVDGVGDALADGPAESAWEPAPARPAPAAGTPSAGGPRVSFGFNLQKIGGQGEDSDPIVRHGRELGLVAVFDGMGGAGGTVYETPDGPRTGAYLASRVARDVVEQQMVALLDPEWNLDGAAAAQDVQRSVRAALQERLAELNAPASGLRSRLLRALPTTMALAGLQRDEPGGDRWTCHLLWAGDSRVYVFEPGSGARQLTADDIRDRGDAMANLREDSVVSNAMSADTEFVVHHRQVELTTPFLVIAATDGCFGYLPSPMHFEHLVLTALRDTQDTDSWSAAVQAAISAVTGDDAAMATLGLGADHAAFQKLFAQRTAELERRWIAPLDDLDTELRKQERTLHELRAARQERQARLWAAYKPGYEEYL